MDANEIKRLDKEHYLHSWSVQGPLNPEIFDHGQGAYYWTADGKRYLDLASQLMNLNTGYQHPKIVKAIQVQAEKSCYCGPGFATEERSRLMEALSRIMPGDLKYYFLTLGGAESNENAIKIARLYSGKFKILSRYRSYHGATFGAITLSGDPRRPPVEPGIPGVVHVLDPFCYRCSFHLNPQTCGLQCANHIEEIIQYENPDTVAAIFMEGVTGSNGIIVPPPGYMARVREICDHYKVLLICDEVMSGFGRTGQWFAIQNWNVVPDMITMAKGLTSGYVPLGAVAVSKKIGDYFQDHMLWCGLTYNAHPLACGTAVATLKVYEEEGLIENARKLGTWLMQQLEGLKAKHRCVGDVRGIGLFTAIDLVKDRATHEPLIPWNAKGSEMTLNKEIYKRIHSKGIYVSFRWNFLYVIPPLVITQAQLQEGLDVIDEALSFADKEAA